MCFKRVGGWYDGGTWGYTRCGTRVGTLKVGQYLGGGDRGLPPFCVDDVDGLEHPLPVLPLLGAGSCDPNREGSSRGYNAGQKGGDAVGALGGDG